VRPALPYLGLAAGLVLATAPAWRAVLFGAGASVDDLLLMRCLPW